MKVIIKKVNEEPYEAEINDELSKLQEIVGGYIETVRFIGSVLLICNEEGLIREMEPNFYFRGHVIVGDVFFVGVSGSEFRSLTEEEIRIVKGAFEV